MKLFAINDYEVWMGPSKEAVLEGLKSEYVELEDLVFEDGVKELSDEALDRLMFNDSDDRDYTGFHHWQCECGAMADARCRWNGQAYEHPHPYPVGHVLMKNIHRRPFREELARLVASGAGVQMFSSTEY
ncbi:hypothetical protein [Verrucomicrobium spinosum]|uniref:hypothetical protein n=1 Tax=Verrucomicrobium spinosum TaxID=2736 RepID=UPI00017465E2|nr:hypothetical protein [Verrucomicrobium spinosum]